MDINKLTQRSQEAVLAARAAAAERNHQYVGPEHLMLALLAQSDGIVYPLLNRLDASPADLRRDVDAALRGLPNVYGGAEVTFHQKPCRCSPRPMPPGRR